MAIDTAALRKELERKKLILDEKYAIAEVAARKVVERYKELLVAEESRDLKNGSKEIARHEVAEDAFNLAVKEYFRFAEIYDSLVEAVISSYEELIETDCEKTAKKTRSEAQRFEERERYRKDRLSDIVAKVNGVNESYFDYISDKKAKEERIDEALDFKDVEDETRDNAFLNEPDESYLQTDAQKQNVPFEAVNIDITRIVESAVASAMDKFNAVLESRTNQIIKEGSKDSATKIPDTSESENIFKLHSGLVDLELEIAAKLSVLTEKLKNLSEDLIKTGVTCIELSNTQKEVAKMQSETADMQAALLKSAEEVSEKQKLITEEHSSVVSEQAALFERQKSNVEAQASLGASQSELEELQKSILDAHTALSATTAEIFESQKQITEMQRTVMSAQAKNLEQQRALTEKQFEISELQKTAFSEHKYLKKKLKKK